MSAPGNGVDRMFWATYGAQLAAHGYRTLKIDAGRKHTREVGWNRRGIATPVEIAAWSVNPYIGIGIITGMQPDGTVIAAIDVDIRHAQIAATMRRMLRDRYGVAVARYGQRPKFIVLVRLPEETRKVTSAKFRLPGDAGDDPGHHVEVLCAGQQFVSYALHPGTGAPYEWEGGEPAATPPDKWPLLSLEDVEEIVAEGNRLLREAGGVAVTPGKPDAEAPLADDPARANPALHAGVYALLDEAGLLRKPGRHGVINIECPFVDGHSEHPLTGTALMPGGGIKCHHASCEGRTVEDYIDELKGRVGEDVFEEAVAEAEREEADGLADIEAEFEAGINGEAPHKTNGTAPPPGAKAAGREPEWGGPFDFWGDTAAIAELTAAHVPAAVFAFARDTAERMGVEPSSVALASLVTLSAACSDDWKIQPKRYDDTWTEEARLWGLLVDKPGGMKSPIIKAATAPLQAIQDHAEKTYRRELLDHIIAVRMWKHEQKTQPDPAKPEPQHPKRKRYLIESTTIEAATEVLRTDTAATQTAPLRKVLLRQDEMTEFLANLDRYREGSKGAGDRGAYLRAHVGGPFNVDRIIRGSFTIPNWSIPIISAVQPEPFQRIAKDAVDDGMLQRFLYNVAGEARDGVDRKPDHKAATDYEGLFVQLVDMLPEHAGRCTLAVAAQKTRERVDAVLKAAKARPEVSSRVVSALDKWRGGWARLVLLFHLIDAADRKTGNRNALVSRTISVETAEMAAAYMEDILLPHLLRADALMFKTVQTSHAAWIAGHILSKGLAQISGSIVSQAYPALRPSEMKQTRFEVLDGMTDLGWLRGVPGRGGRITSWAVNPAVHSLFAGRAKVELTQRVAKKDKIARAARLRQGKAKQG